MGEAESRVIGYFALVSPSEVVCTDGDACVIAGSEKSMREHLREVSHGAAGAATIRKTRFGEIVRGLQLGAAYAFDEESYGRFLPLARNAGLPVKDADFAAHAETGSRFFTVRLGRRSLVSKMRQVAGSIFGRDRS